MAKDTPRKTRAQCAGCRHLKALHGSPPGECMAIGCKCPEYTPAKEN